MTNRLIIINKMLCIEIILYGVLASIVTAREGAHNRGGGVIIYINILHTQRCNLFIRTKAMVYTVVQFGGVREIAVQIMANKMKMRENVKIKKIPCTPNMRKNVIRQSP